MDAPTSIDTGRVMERDDQRCLQVVDANTGEPVSGVIAADAIAGTVRRFEVENGNLVRDGDTFVIVDERRDIRIEWIVPMVVDVSQPTGAQG
ncbi:hypothetical protein [Sphingomonas sp. CFBP 8760]|uniref:hypothetical protein n=1 Tax=Sphingomonas sp. CFBP 8760 TaxID=2775282 RepID=UPI00177F0ABE|nr:hypothetical protein [Sphingomonas sp. CFBP 8760]MBD8548004.1 hypothetical protein [Sphingomonas sp. CFBP 8760]